MRLKCRTLDGKIVLSMSPAQYAVFLVSLLFALGSLREWTRRRHRRTLKIRAAIFATLSAETQGREG